MVRYSNMIFMSMWLQFALDFKRPEPLRVALERFQMTFADSDARLDRLRPHSSIPFSPRGEPTSAGFMWTFEYIALLSKTAHVLLDGAAAVSADEILATLPSWKEFQVIMHAGLDFSSCLLICTIIVVQLVQRPDKVTLMIVAGRPLVVHD